jgi:hypothetical protein
VNEYKNLADSLNKNKDGIPRARRFRDNLTTIELILSTGIRIRYLVECLNNNDFKITTKAFKEELHRARKQLKQQTDISHPPANTPTPTKQTKESQKQNAELSVSPPVLSSDEIAKSYFTPQPFLKNKENK